jgi:two-component sensor histidine kinase
VSTGTEGVEVSLRGGTREGDTIGMTELSESSRSGETQTLEALQAALDRERARAREVDHRAKNSLQIVSSLLLLMSRRSASQEAQQALKAMHQRVAAIAAVHREILDGDSPEYFDLTQFVRGHVAAVARARGDGAEVRMDLAPVRVAATQACPAALIVNELALNALTHGSPAGCEPRAEVVLKPAGAGFSLTVADTGPGLAPTADQSGFGLTIVKLLAQQISAHVAFEDAQPGLRAVVTAA